MRRRHKGRKSRVGGQNAEFGGEYWGRRLGPREPGRFFKTVTHRRERRIAKAELRELVEIAESV